MGRISYAVALFTAAALAAAAPAQGKAKEKAPRFADYPVTKLSHIRVARPKIPESWDEDPRLRFQDSVGDDDKPNFAGRYFVATWGCGSTCVWGGIVEAESGRIIELPSVSGWFDTHDKFEAIDFRHNSRLLVLSGARNEKKGDMGRHYYVLENGKLRWLKTIKQGRNFMELNR
jgi:hypothetical protein